MLLRLKLNEAKSRSFIWCIFSRCSFLESGRDGVGYDEKVIILKVVDTCKKRQKRQFFQIRCQECSTYIEQKLMMSLKYIVLTAFGTYFHQVSLYATCHGKVGTWAPTVRYLQFWGRSISFKISLIEAKIGKEIQKAL